MMSKMMSKMENLEFYEHGSRFQYAKSLENIISTVHILLGSATITKCESRLYLVLQLTIGTKHRLQFDLKGDRYLEMEYLDLEDVIFFATNKEFILFQGSQILALKEWPSTVCSLKLSPGLKLAVYYEDGTIVSYGFDPLNGNLLNPFQANLDIEPENAPLVMSTEFKPYKNPTRASTYLAIGEPTIAWGSEDKHYVVNAVKNDSRILLVISKTGQLLYKSEPGMFPGLETPIAVDGENSFIACILSETGSDQELVIVQKNLEILYSLKLEDAAKVKKIQWSNCSEVLAVWHKSDRKSWLDLYLKRDTEFKWKQRLPFCREEELLNFRFAFSMENSFIIQMIFRNYLFQYCFMKKLSKSESFGGEINMASQINGKDAEMYFFGKGMLSRSGPIHATVPSNDYISSVVFDSFRPTFAIIDIDYFVRIYKCTETDILVVAEFSLDKNGVVLPLTYYRFFFDPKGNFCAIRMGNTKDFSSDTLYHFKEPTFGFWKKGMCNPRIIKGQCIINRTDIIADRDDAFRLVPCHKALISDYIIFKFRYEYSFTRFCVGSIDINSISLKGLFSSMHFTNTHILLTCHRESVDPVNDCLIALELNEASIQYLIVGSGTIFDLAYSLPIARGGIILNDIPKTSMIALLLPTGKQECVHLRNMSLKQLNQVLLEKDFGGAYNIIKSESLELSLIVDLNPNFFKENLREIIVCLHENRALHKFLIQLSDSSSLTSEDKKLFTPHLLKNKRSEVCNMVIKLILGFENPIDYLSEVAVAGLCFKPEGFNSVKAAEVVNATVRNKFIEHKPAIARAMKRLASYITYDILYLAVLEVDNIDLAELVAQLGGMPTHKVGPFLTKLRSLSDLDRKQTIAKFLGRMRDTVMYYLQRYEEGEITYEELLVFADEHKCYDMYYQELISKGPVPKEIALKYSSQLEEEEKFKEAGVVLTGFEMHREAYELFSKGLFWEEAISSLYRIADISSGERKHECIVTAKRLESEKRYKDAAIIYQNFCEDPLTAADMYIKGLHFKEAYHVMLEQHLLGSIEQVLLPAIKQTMNAKCSHLKQLQIYYTFTFDRLMKIRENLMNAGSDDEKNISEDPDYVSVADTVVTKEQEYMSVVGSVSAQEDYFSTAGSSGDRKEAYFPVAGSSRMTKEDYTALMKEDCFSEIGSLTMQDDYFSVGGSVPPPEEDSAGDGGTMVSSGGSWIFGGEASDESNGIFASSIRVSTSGIFASPTENHEPPLMYINFIKQYQQKVPYTPSTSNVSARTAPEKMTTEEGKQIYENSKYEDIVLMRHFHTLVDNAYEISNSLEEYALLLDLITLTKEHVFSKTILGHANDFKKQMIDTADQIWPPALKRFDVKGPEEAMFVHIHRLGLKYRAKPPQLKLKKTKK